MQPIIRRTLLLQSAVVCVAVAAGAVWNAHACRAALLAGVIAIFPALAYARLIRRADQLHPRMVVRLHAVGEAVRLVLSIALLTIAFAFLNHEFSIPYFFGVYVATLTMYGVALIFK